MSEGGALVRFHDWRAAGDRKAATRRLRFNSRPETQPRAGTIRAGAKNGKTEANQATIRSTATGFAPARNRRSQEKSTALGRLGCQQG